MNQVNGIHPAAVPDSLNVVPRSSRVVGVILSAGVGARFNSPTPKQYVKLAGRMVVEHTIDAFESSPDVDEIVVVAAPAYADLLWTCASRNGWKKLSKIVAGGENRFDSTLSALSALENRDPNDLIVTHDAVRPLISHRILRDCVVALQEFQACDVVIPSADTIVQIDDNACISAIPPRSTQRRGQTPQAFRLGTLRDAYAKAALTGSRDFTCDCGVVRAMLPAVRVVTVDGDDTNVKITNQSDLFLAENLFQTRHLSRTNLSSVASKRLRVALDGRVVVVVGGTGGIGGAIADRCRLCGSTVEICSRSTGVDVACFRSIDAFLVDVARRLGRVDYVVNATGLLLYKPLELMSDDEVRESIDVNYLGAVNVARAALPHLKATKGCLVFFTSSSYTRGRPFYSLYSSSKSAVVNLAQALSEEWADCGVRVVCINPERTNTRMRRETFGAEPSGTLLEPAQVADETILAMLSLSGVVVDVRNTAIPPTLGGAAPPRARGGDR